MQRLNSINILWRGWFIFYQIVYLARLKITPSYWATSGISTKSFNLSAFGFQQVFWRIAYYVYSRGQSRIWFTHNFILRSQPPYTRQTDKYPGMANHVDASVASSSYLLWVQSFQHLLLFIFDICWQVSKYNLLYHYQ